MARAAPVLPDEFSTIVPPGFKSPFLSASSMMNKAILSFTLPAGLRNSSLAKMFGFMSRVILFNLTRGVQPMVFRISGLILPNFSIRALISALVMDMMLPYQRGYQRPDREI